MTRIYSTYTMPHKKARRFQGEKTHRRNKVKLVHGGKEFFDLLKHLIDGARHSIHIQAYIFVEDSTGISIGEAIINAAKRNVEVWLIVDGFASQGLSKSFIGKLKQAGVNIRFFEPLFRSRNFYFGRRMHHKIIVIDGVRALTGSMNIADRYNDLPGKPAWYDLALYVEGDAAVDLYWFCCRFWANGRKIKFRPPDTTGKMIDAIPEEQNCAVSILQNDWVYRKLKISKYYLNTIRNTKERISIVSSYFLPRKKIMNELKRAVKRGVDVKIILTKVSDVKTAKYAEQYLYRWILRNNIRIYEYKSAVLHAKLAIADGQVLTLGSYNVNHLSDHVSVELNLGIKCGSFVSQVEKEIDDLIKNDCVEVDPKEYTNSLFSLKHFLQWTSYQFLRLLLTVFTFYFRQRD